MPDCTFVTFVSLVSRPGRQGSLVVEFEGSVRTHKESGCTRGRRPPATAQSDLMHCRLPPWQPSAIRSGSRSPVVSRWWRRKAMLLRGPT